MCRIHDCFELEDAEEAKTDQMAALEEITTVLLRKIETYRYQSAGPRLTSLRRQLVGLRLKYTMI